eukprot:3684469-Amphidinium_carterae.1
MKVDPGAIFGWKPQPGFAIVSIIDAMQDAQPVRTELPPEEGLLFGLTWLRKLYHVRLGFEE